MRAGSEQPEALLISACEGGWALTFEGEVVAICHSREQAVEFAEKCALIFQRETRAIETAVPSAPLRRVLIVDDDPILRFIATSQLEKHGLTVSELADGQDVLATVAAEAIELVVIDMLMPNKDGVETIRELRQHRPGVRILAISSGGRVKANDLLHLAVMCGADATMLKPLKEDTFVGAVLKLAGTVNQPLTLFGGPQGCKAASSLRAPVKKVPRVSLHSKRFMRHKVSGPPDVIERRGRRSAPRDATF